MNYAIGYALGLKDLFKNFDFKKLKLTTKTCELLVKNRHKELIMIKIMKSCIKLIIDDIIHNNATFHLPTGKKEVYIKIKAVKDEEFVKARKNGKWRDVDFIKSNFTGHQMIFKYQSGGVMREKPIYLDPTNKNKITEHTNEGKLYF